jgi:hypothetical protein
MRRISVPTGAAPDLDALQAQEVAPHAAAGERVLQVQFVDPAHQAQLRRAHRLGLVVHRAAADVQQLGLTLDRQIVRTVDHRFALSRPALLSAPSSQGFEQLLKPSALVNPIEDRKIPRIANLPRQHPTVRLSSLGPPADMEPSSSLHRVRVA